jgi:hypothetical protein
MVTNSLPNSDLGTCSKAFRGKVRLATLPVGRVFFRYIGADLTLKLAWWESEASGKPDKLGRFQWKDRTLKRSLSPGNRRLVTAEPIGSQKILIQLEDPGVHQWLLLDVAKLMR